MMYHCKICQQIFDDDEQPAEIIDNECYCPYCYVEHIEPSEEDIVGVNHKSELGEI